MNVQEIKNLKRILAFEDDFAVIETTDNKSGIINRFGEVVLEPKDYDMAFHCKDGLFLVDEINENGKTHPIYFNAYSRQVIPHDIDLHQYDDTSSYQCVAEDGKYYYINQQGERLTKRSYEYLELANFGLAIMKLNGFYGLIDHSENIVLTTSIKEEDDANNTDRNFYWCGYNRIAFRNNDLLGIMDTKGNILVEPKFSWIDNNFKESDQKIMVRDSDNNAGMIGLNGQIITPCEYKRIGYEHFHTHIVHTNNDKWGLIDAQGQIILPAIYDSININETYGLNEIAVKKDGRCYFINEKQEEVKVF